MRASGDRRTGVRRAGVLATALALGGCGGPPATPMPTGLDVTVRTTPLAVPGLQLTSSKIVVENLFVLGDVTPDPQRSEVSEVEVDLLAPSPSIGFSALPQGYYSRLRFELEKLAIDGTFQGAPVSMRLLSADDYDFDLRLRDGVELQPGDSPELAVTIDVGSWFSADDLAAADVDPSGAILVDDDTNNVFLAALIEARILGSCSLAGRDR